MTTPTDKRSLGDAILISVGMVCASGIIIVLVLSQWAEADIVAFVGGLALQVPLIVSVYRNHRAVKDDTTEIKGQLNGQLDARIQAAVSSALTAGTPPNGQTGPNRTGDLSGD